MSNTNMNRTSVQKNSANRTSFLLAALIGGTVLLVLVILSGCVSIDPYLRKSGDPADVSEDAYTKYFFINNVDPAMGNNAYFAQNAAVFEPYLDTLGYEKAAYLEADLLLLLSYGIENREIAELVREPRYNELKNSTEWLHEENRTRKSVFFTLKAVDAEDYRAYGLESEIWLLDYALPADEIPVEYPPVSADRGVDFDIFAEIVSRAMHDSVPAAFQAVRGEGDGK